MVIDNVQTDVLPSTIESVRAKNVAPMIRNLSRGDFVVSNADDAEIASVPDPAEGMIMQPNDVVSFPKASSSMRPVGRRKLVLSW